MRGSLNQQLTTGAVSGKNAVASGQWADPGEARAHTLTFDATGFDSAGLFDASWSRFTVATVRWKVGGNTISRKVSVLHGQALSGVAESVQVEIQDQSLNPAAAPARNYNVICLVAPGTRASNGQFPVLYPALAPPILGPGGSITVTIDPDAGAIAFRLPYLDTAPPAAYVAGNLSVAFTVGATTLEQYDPNVDPRWVPIPPGATAVVITNNSAARTYQVTPIFGIEG